MKTFKEIGLNEDFLKILEEHKFKEPSEIQEKTIPLALAGKDIIGGSATGSGKTLAFGASIIQFSEPTEGLQALILTPTRELAEQVSRSLDAFAKFKQLKVIAVYGGVSLMPQMQDLKSADIVVGTPGRILDHMSRRTINFSKIKYLVLDEADRMLDMGFLDDVKKIIDHCPKHRQTMLFSATISREIADIAQKYMKNPVEVSLESKVDPSKLEQFYYDVPAYEKFSLLVHLLKQEHSKLVMVFCNTKRNTDFIGRHLREQELNAMALHGDLSQNKRSKILEYFHKSEKFILVCTDVAARGLDIKNVSHVYNYDSPKTSVEYVHRIGRTARAGKEGKAITILGDKDYDNFRRVKADHSLNIKKLETPKFDIITIAKPQSRQDYRDFRKNRDNDDRPRNRFQGSHGRSYGGDNRSRDDKPRSRFQGNRSDREDRPRVFSRARNFQRQHRRENIRFRNRW